MKVYYEPRDIYAAILFMKTVLGAPSSGSMAETAVLEVEA
jgi:hypothetical protein